MLCVGGGGGNKEPWIVFRLSILLALFAPAGNQVSCNHVWQERKQNKRKKNKETAENPPTMMGGNITSVTIANRHEIYEHTLIVGLYSVWLQTCLQYSMKSCQNTAQSFNDLQSAQIVWKVKGCLAFLEAFLYS